jgi:hypothetical protein
MRAPKITIFTSVKALSAYILRLSLQGEEAAAGARLAYLLKGQKDFEVVRVISKEALDADVSSAFVYSDGKTYHLGVVVRKGEAGTLFWADGKQATGSH